MTTLMYRRRFLLTSVAGVTAGPLSVQYWHGRTK